MNEEDRMLILGLNVELHRKLNHIEIMLKNLFTEVDDLGSYLNELPGKLNRDPEHTRKSEYHKHSHVIGQRCRVCGAVNLLKRK